ncbi:MAG: ABC transporter ATP-binding protein [Rhizobiales bacterium]|nr:ABC transporter ATP-binding protein [Hyphomicrobiales bacterium]
MMIEAQDIILEARNVAVTFKVEGGEVKAVKNMNFALRKGETIAIVGESGSGKSVTARAVMRLLSKRATISRQSSIFLDGHDVTKLSEREMRALRGDKVSMIFQEPMTSLNPVYTVGSQIVEVIRIHNKISKAGAWARALELLKEVHIPDPEARIRQYPHQLSGGQRQRVMIAMALANRPDILIADEPTTALDVTVQAQILNLIKELKDKHGMAVILITHDLTVVRQFADRVYVMQHGEVKEHNATEALFRNPRHPYTKRLLSSDPKGVAKPLEDGHPSILTGKDVRVTYTLKRGGLFNATYSDLHAVDRLSLDLKRGETLGLVGESGSGKTTFGQALIRLLNPQEGEIAFDGKRIDGLKRDALRPFRSRMQIVFQDPFSSMNPRMNVRQIIEEGLIVNSIGSSPADRLGRVQKALADAGMPADILSRFPHEFSGGQRQRLAIARAIAMEPEFIMLDEPTSALDLSVQAQIIELLRTLQRERGLSYLFISHDLKVVRALCHRVIVMQHGKIMEQGPVAQVLTNPKTGYTKRLVRAAFDIAA